MALRIIHTADWHLGQTFYGYDRELEHDVFLSWLSDVIKEQEIDVLLITGDVFDVANPSASSQFRFFHFLRQVNRQNPSLQIVIIAGNHDSASRLEAPIPLLEELNTAIVGLIKRSVDGEIDLEQLLVPLRNRQGESEGWCMAIPFLRQGDYPAPEELPDSYVRGVYRMYHQLYDLARQRCGEKESIVALGHLHATGAELTVDDRSERLIMGGLESVSIDTFPSGIAYTALGHIHKAQRVGGKENVRYAGSPLPMSFSEVNYRHQVILVTLEKGSAISIESFPVPRAVDLIRIPKQPSVPEEVLAELAALPDAGEEELSFAPYLEIQVLLTEPDPTLRHRVEEVIAGKAVRLASIVTSYPKKEDSHTLVPVDYSELQKINPTDMLKHAFSTKYGGDLPEEMEGLFTEVLREVEV